MSRTAKWLVAATILSIVGIVMFAVAMAAIGWNFTRLDNDPLITNTHYVTEEFSDISIVTDTSDVIFVRSQDGECKVVLSEGKKTSHVVKAEDGILTIKVSDERKWYEYISFFSFGKEQITVYLPQESYGALTVDQSTGDIKLPSTLRFESLDATGSTGDAELRASVNGTAKIQRSTGDIEVEGADVGALNLTTSTGDIEVSRVTCSDNISIRVSTGDVELEDLSCNNLASNGGTGEIDLENVVASGTMQIKRSTGTVELVRCDGAEIRIDTSTGDVKGSLNSPKIFFTETDTGSVRVPQLTTGGVCRITTTTGDIRITVK